MAAAAPRAPLSVYMLADHLDAALAAGEDLIARGQDWRHLAEAPGNMQTFPARQREIVEDIRALELMAIARILKARDHARALATMDERFAAVANLFASGTGQLMDAVDECGDATAGDFDTGDGVTAYARSRGLIPADAPSIAKSAQLTIDESFRVATRLPLGELMDMSAAFLDALEVQYELFSSDDEPAMEAVDHIAAPVDTSGSANQEEQIAAPPASPQAKASQSPVSGLTSGLLPRREFGQRNRSPLN